MHSTHLHSLNNIATIQLQQNDDDDEKMEFEQLIVELFSIGCVKFGEFTLKSGIKSPVYFDLRVLISHPKLLKLACEVFADKINKMGIQYDVICGVPYGAIALATGISFNTNKPMIFKRKETKCHGTKKSVEGNFKEGDRCLIVDDVMTSGISIMETVEGLRENGIQTDEAFVLLDREQGGAENLAKQNIKIHSVLKTTDVLNILLNNKKLNKEMYDKTLTFLNENKNVTLSGKESPKRPTELTFEARGAMCQNKIAKQLFEIMTVKQSNLCVAADYTSFDELLKLADQIGPHVCMIKTHVDIMNDFSMDQVQRLVDLAIKHNFLIFEDRKFADIGNTVKLQYGQGVYKIAQWAHIINAHSITGPGIISGLKEVTDFQNKGCLLIAQLSSKGNLINESYIKNTVEMAESNQDYVIGFICQKKLTSNPVFLHMTPGVQFNDGEMKDSLGQQYTSPETAILEHQCDIVIVGRGIIKSEDPVQSAIRYKTAAYESYLQRVSNL